jgi:hypothetical protein
MIKMCKYCNVEKDIKDFPKHRSRCKKCLYELNKTYKNNDTYKSYLKEYNKQYYIKNKNNNEN